MDELSLVGVVVALGIEVAQVVVHASAVACLGQTQALLTGVEAGAQRGLLSLQGGVDDEGIVHFTEGRLDGLFVVGDGDVLAHCCQLQIGLITATRKDRQA